MRFTHRGSRNGRVRVRLRVRARVVFAEAGIWVSHGEYLSYRFKPFLLHGGVCHENQIPFRFLYCSNAVRFVRQGFEDKLPTALEIIHECRLTPEQVCYIGDDLTDLPVIRAVGLGAAVSDAAVEVRSAAAHVTQLPGGRGAVRELVETILKAKSRWDDAVQRYMT